MITARNSSSRTIPPGRTWTARRHQIIAQISELVGTDLSEAFRYPTVGAALRWHTRYARQNGVHVSPTFLVNRIVNTNMSSGQAIEDWAKELGL